MRGIIISQNFFLHSMLIGVLHFSFKKRWLKRVSIFIRLVSTLCVKPGKKFVCPFKLQHNEHGTALAKKRKKRRRWLLQQHFSAVSEVHLAGKRQFHPLWKCRNWFSPVSLRLIWRFLTFCSRTLAVFHRPRRAERNALQIDGFAANWGITAAELSLCAERRQIRGV